MEKLTARRGLLLNWPFSVMVSWMYTSLDQVGGSTENPFEAGSNDVPISMLARTVERELKEMLGDSNAVLMQDQEANVVLQLGSR